MLHFIFTHTRVGDERLTTQSNVLQRQQHRKTDRMSQSPESYKISSFCFQLMYKRLAAVRLGCKEDLVVTGWGNSHPGYMNELSKHYS